MSKFGCIKSEIDGSEHIFDYEKNTMPLPKEYSYMKYMTNIINQGNESICVPCSISTHLNWKKNIEDGIIEDNKINLYEIYDNRSNKLEDNGMTFKDALKYLRKEGVSYKDGKLKIDSYAMITNEMALKYAIISNGPCVGGLPVYNNSDYFWNKNYNDEFLGLHAVAIIGYNNDGFIIRNSWGKSYGRDGYFLLKKEDLNKFVELWTIIG